MIDYIKTKNPLHARAYLKAASFYLSGWPQEWDAETLALALLADDDGEEESEASKNQGKILLWQPIETASDGEDPYVFTDQMICDLAESFLEFLNENK